MAEDNNTNNIQQDYENIIPWNGSADRGRDVRMKWQRNFDKIKNNFIILKSCIKEIPFDIVEDENGNKKIVQELPFKSIQIGDAYLKYNPEINALYIEKEDGSIVNFYTTGGVSAYGQGTTGGTGGGGIIESVYDYSHITDVFNDNDKTNTFNAYTIAQLAARIKAVEQQSITSVAWNIINGRPTDERMASWDEAYSVAHSHSNIAVLNGITSTLIGNWNTAYTNSHTHSNKDALDDITAKDVAWIHNLLSLISVVDGNVKIDANLYSTGGISAYGYGESSGGGGTDYDRLDAWSAYDSSKAGYVLSALLGSNLNTRLSAVEQSTITSVEWNIISGRPTDTRMANWDAAYSAAHSHSNKSVLDGVTSGLVSNWNSAYTIASSLDSYIGDLQSQIDSLNIRNQFDDLYATFVGADSMSAQSVFVDYIQVGSARLYYDSANNALFAQSADGSSVNFYSTGGVTAYGQGTTGGSSGGGGTDYDRLDAWSAYDSSKAGYVLSALLGSDLNTRLSAVEGAGYITFLLVDSFVGDLQSQIDSLNIRNQFEDIYATFVGADSISASYVFADNLTGKLAWSYITSLPTTIAGYGITDGVVTSDYRLSNSRPASDVYSWAKEPTKPSYTKSEVGLGNVDNTADSAKSVKYAASAGYTTNSLSWSGYNSGSFNGSTAKSFVIPNTTSQITEGSNLYYTSDRVLSVLDSYVGDLQSQINVINRKNQFDDLFATFVGADSMAAPIMFASEYIQIGNIRIVFDSANNALKVVKADGSAANIYSTGGITACA